MIESNQVRFLKSIQEVVSGNISFVNEMSDLLEISHDSAYRRMRGETSLTFDEIGKLSNRYNISIDGFNQSPDSQVVSFKYNTFEPTVASFRGYLSQLHQEISLTKSSAAHEKHVLFAGQGIPIFHYFNFPLLSSFKMFYWMKSILDVEELKERKFLPEFIDTDLLDTGREIFNNYLEIPSTEIWTDTTVMGSLHQIQFYWDSGILSNKEVALNVCEELRDLLNYCQQLCESNKKQDNYTSPSIFGAPLKLYYSEIEFENNCIIVNVGDQKRVYLGQLNFSSISTENHRYHDETSRWLNGIISKSNLISGASQTIRFQFFKRCLKHLEKLERRIQAD